MKLKIIPRWALVVAVMVVAVALMASVALARSGSGTVFDAAGNQSLSGTSAQLDTTMLSGGRYQLTSAILGYTQSNTPQESEVASGGGYHLQGLGSPRLTGNGCCCLFLPCVVR